MTKHRQIKYLKPLQQQLLIYAFFRDLYARVKNPIENKKIEDFISYCVQQKGSCLYDLVSDIKDDKKTITSLTMNMEEDTSDMDKVREATRLFQATISRLCNIKITLRDRGISLIRTEKFSFLDSRYLPKEVKREGLIKQGLFYRVLSDGRLSVYSIEQSKKYDGILKEDVMTKETWRREYSADGEEEKNGGTVEHVYANPYLNGSYKYITYIDGGYVVRLVWHIPNDIKDNKIIKHEPQLTAGLINKIVDGEQIGSLDNVICEKRLDTDLANAYFKGLMLAKEIYERAQLITDKNAIDIERTKHKRYGPTIMR